MSGNWTEGDGTWRRVDGVYVIAVVSRWGAYRIGRRGLKDWLCGPKGRRRYFSAAVVAMSAADKEWPLPSDGVAA